MTLKERVRRLLAEVGIDEDDAVPTARLREDLCCDSLDLVELAMACEETFQIEMPDADAMRLVTVADVATYLRGRGVAA